MTAAGATAIAPGARVGGCRLVARIGEGALSEVWHAEQESLGRAVAVKFLKASIAPGSRLGQGFAAEAARLARLGHENLPQVHDAGTTDDGRAYLVLERVDGLDLAEVLRRGRPMPWEVATAIALGVARALEHAHRAGIVHRDVKPSNVVLGPRGEVKLVDFGIAVDGASRGDDDGTAVGTPSYMSPEQVLGDALDARSDLFSFGIVYYELLAGRRPFEAEAGRSLLQKIRLDRFEPVRRVRPDVPRPLERVLARCLEKNPAHRYADAGALCEDLADELSRAGVGHSPRRLVAWQHRAGLLTDAQSSKVLGDGASVSEPRTRRGEALRAFALRQAAWALAGCVLVGGVEAVRAQRASRDPTPAPGLRFAHTPGVGFLRVTVLPWAEIAIDGVPVDTTPTAQAFPLAPGEHFVRLRNPAYAVEDRRVRIASEQTVWLDVELHPDSEAPGVR